MITIQLFYDLFFSSVDVCQDASGCELSRESSDISPCFEWPAIKQESPGFNELSDFIVDSCQLNKEITILLKLLGEFASF